MKTARRRWDSIAKPLHSLGKMEDLITQIVGITGDEKVDLGKKALVAMCADNGVVEEGVTQTGQEVTAIVADNFVKETTTACVMCHQCGVDVKSSSHIKKRTKGNGSSAFPKTHVSMKHSFFSKLIQNKMCCRFF